MVIIRANNVKPPTILLTFLEIRNVSHGSNKFYTALSGGISLNINKRHRSDDALKIILNFKFGFIRNRKRTKKLIFSFGF